MYRGDIRLGDTIDVKFTTRSFTTGAPTTLAGTPSIAAYPGNSTTEITAGITLTVDFDARTGLHNVRVVATSGNGYATATNYDLVITAGTVGGVSVVGEVIGSFSIEARSALMPTTAARTLDVSATGEAGIDWANIGSPTTAVNLSATNIDVDQVVASVSGAVGSVTGAVGSVTGNVGGNVTGSVGSVATGGITSGSFAAGAINAAAIAADAIGASELAADAVAEIADAVWDEARAGHVAAGSFGEGVASVQGNVTGSVASVTGAVGSVTGAVGSVTGNVGGNVAGSVGSVTGAVGSVTGNVGGNVTGSVGSVAAGGITAASIATGAIDADALAADAVAEIADGVWDEATAGHTTAGTTGKALTDAGSAGDPWSTAVPGAYGAGTAGYILGTNLDTTVSSRLATSGYTAPLSAAGTRTALGMASADLDTQLAALPTATENADALLGRNVAGGADGTRTVSQALYVLRNKTAISGGTLTVYQTDDATPSFTATVGTTAGDPISSIDPA